ncbi:hypothetical protein KCP78_02815 [Salmonella enterica subsp. enterica]|nr:hypothetical protein KCP78_02815 [Salmonella enterica subsp. enterica]
MNLYDYILKMLGKLCKSFLLLAGWRTNWNARARLLRRASGIGRRTIRIHRDFSPWGSSRERGQRIFNGIVDLLIHWRHHLPS